MNTKTKELLLDLAHEIHQAIISDDDAIANVALADVADALASVLPTEHASSPLTPPISDETAEPDGRAASMTPPPDELQGYAQFLTVAPGVQLVRFKGKKETKLVARRVGSSGNPNTIFEINVCDFAPQAEIIKDGKRLCFIMGDQIKGSRKIEKLAVSALHRYLKDQRPCKAKRRRAARLRAEQKEVQ